MNSRENVFFLELYFHEFKKNVWVSFSVTEIIMRGNTAPVMVKRLVEHCKALIQFLINKKCMRSITQMVIQVTIQRVRNNIMLASWCANCSDGLSMIYYQQWPSLGQWPAIAARRSQIPIVTTTFCVLSGSNCHTRILLNL